MSVVPGDLTMKVILHHQQDNRGMAHRIAVNALTAATTPCSQSNFPALCHNTVHRDVEHLALPISIKLIQCIDNIMLIGSVEQKEQGL